MKHLTTLFLLVICQLVFAQRPIVKTPDGGGEYFFPTSQEKCLTKEQRAYIIKNTQQNIYMLERSGKIPTPAERSPSLVAFDFPLQKAGGLTFNNFYGISNYVDNDATTGIEDYNCGTRSYDGHDGIDFFTWPFLWYLVANDMVEVIAAEAGTIVDKYDGNPDEECSLPNLQWNGINIQHADGSVAWYGHLKNGSVTSKTIGQTVTKGEYLGVVASSGRSSGPHLHFEVYSATPESSANRIDPYGGTCNAYNGSTSWWATQEDYNVPTLNALMTHSAAPVIGCPSSNETPNFSDTYELGETAYFAIYFRDETVGDSAVLTVRRPNNSIWTTWTHRSTTAYTASYWWWNIVIASGNPTGAWKFEVDFKGSLFTYNFTVTNVLPVELTSFTGRSINENDVLLNWTTTSEHNNAFFEIQHSTNGNNFVPIGKIDGNGNSTSTIHYDFTHFYPSVGINYYRLKQVDLDGTETFSDVVSVELKEEDTKINIFPNPVKDLLFIKGFNAPNIEIEVLDNWGRIIFTEKIIGEQINISDLPEGLYYLKIKKEKEILFKRFVKSSSRF